MPMDFDNAELTENDHPALMYQAMLADEVRMERYARAIAQVVRPGDVVADLGTGLGVLALMAARAGAKRVFAIDSRPGALWVAERLVAANEGGERVELVEGNVREVTLDEPVDVIVNELIGNFGTDEGIHESVRMFARNNLKPDGRILPESLRTYLVPAEYDREFRGIWRQDNAGLDLRPAIAIPCKPEPVMHSLRRRPKELAPAFCLEDITFSARMERRAMTVDFQFEIDKPGTLQGFVGYFDATLAEGITIDNYPCYPTCHWENWNWPVSPPVEVEPGQVIDVTMLTKTDMFAQGWVVRWRTA